ncbi:unnamed protein product, partial [Rotaria sp. Silwood1]
MLDTIIASIKLDARKSITILKSKEHGFDINLFQTYWINKYHQTCHVIHPDQIYVINGQLCNRNNGYPIEQLIMELHQDEILSFSDDILHTFIYNTQLRYMNDLRTIFLVHDK